MTNTNDSYEKLLQYLEGESSKKKVPTVQNVDREKVSVKTQKILEESQIEEFSEIPRFKHKDKSSGFDVDKLKSLMRARLIDNYKKLQSYERPYISVTELIYCLRKNYYERKRYTFDLSKLFTWPFLYIRQKVGNTIHDSIQELYDFDDVEKTVVSEKFKVKGRADGIKNEYIFEIKSYEPKKGKEVYQEDHYLQPLIYSYILNSEYGYNIKKIVIIYVQLNLKNIFAIEKDVDQKTAEKLLNRSLILQDCLTKNIVPDPLGATTEQCKFCLYKESCEKDESNSVKQPFLKQKQKEKQEKEAVFVL